MRLITRRAGRLILIVAALTTIGCDRVTKHVAETMLAGMPERSYLNDTVRIGYAENPGGFLGIGANLPQAARTAFFTVATGLALVALGVLAIGPAVTGLARLGLTLFIAGGGSNWIDRIVRGSVVDFLNVGVGPVRTGIFNVADVAIIIGAGLLLMAEFRKHREPEPAPIQPSESSHH